MRALLAASWQAERDRWLLWVPVLLTGGRDCLPRGASGTGSLSGGAVGRALSPCRHWRPPPRARSFYPSCRLCRLGGGFSIGPTPRHDGRPADPGTPDRTGRGRRGGAPDRTAGSQGAAPDRARWRAQQREDRAFAQCPSFHAADPCRTHRGGDVALRSRDPAAAIAANPSGRVRFSALGVVSGILRHRLHGRNAYARL